MNHDKLHHDEAVEPLLQGLREFERFGVSRPANASLNEFLEALMSREIVPRKLGGLIISEYHNRRFGNLPDDEKLQEILSDLRQTVAEFGLRAVDQRAAVVAQLNEQFHPEDFPSPAAESRLNAPIPSVKEALPDFAPFPAESIADAPAAAQPYWSRKAVLRMAIAAASLWTLGVLIGGYIVHERLDVVVTKVSGTLGYSSSDTSHEVVHAVREERQPLQQRRVEMLSNMADSFHSRNLAREALYAYHLSLYYDPSNAEIMNGLAWLLLTSPDKSILDAARALPLARRAVELKPTIENLDTLAEALFQNGDFGEAVQIEQRAIDEGKNSPHRDHLLRQHVKFRTAGEAGKVINDVAGRQSPEVKTEDSAIRPADPPHQPSPEDSNTEPTPSQRVEPPPPPLPE